MVASLIVGAAIQGTIGLGLGLVAAPVAGLVAPQFVPELLLWLAVTMALVTLVTEHRGVHWWGIKWALPARLGGTVLGVALVAALTPRELGMAVGVMVLVSVLLTVRTVTLPINRLTLPLAGFVSGVTGTATSIGGPPLAILYQHRSADSVRPTLAAYFVLGAGMSLAGLGWTGQLDPRVFRLAIVLSPTLVVGWLLSLPLRNHLSGPGVRRGILALCAASATVLIVRSALG